MQFAPTELSASEQQLRDDVREFLDAELPDDHVPGLGMAAGHDPEFSRKLAARGWLGMAIPREYGGHDRTAVDRFIVTEELLARGAPLGAHFAADRQSAPTILRFGSEEQRRRFIPKIVAGELWFSLGMSEPDSGSDLSSVRTAAKKVDGGWLLNGTKIWTSNAHRNHYFAVLCRTSPLGEDRHQGLSQLLVDLHDENVEIRPIPFLDGTHHFNEVHLDDVFVPDDMVLGEPGSGWQQVTSELAYERSGPDRFMSTFGLLKYFVDTYRDELDAQQARIVGEVTARYWTVRQLSLAVARIIDAGGAPAVESALVKDIGTKFEQDVIELIRDGVDGEVDPDGETLLETLLARAIVSGPAFTLRGGTTEILRSVASKGLRA
ncbi:alkylation response protein AidB-like acyl-CoA dehydrogenase [Naumannella cuiyingiana]|uniref:Alkylation response protein AidB-like acyl-CoA dehydrogenase n=1 Tax=Naumannella cuiyingiana TaxID=1347891 RepID=A0A7Z0DBW6_9ACTN|nr:acyl-CoA dehydrogenase family protein [Naumannella cuiyingiana]NYI72465.1 alkylation response protein AidB-like acyl-CoA dehydrogenase [Naumannella cuiyingiana]